MWGLLACLLWGVSFITFPQSANGFWFPKQVAWMLGSFLLASSPWWNTPSRPSVRLPALGYIFIWVLLSFGWFVLWPQLTIPAVEVGAQRVVGQRWYVSPILPTFTILGSLLALDALVRHTDNLIRWQRIALHLVRIGSLLSLIVIGQALHLNPLATWIAIAPNSPWKDGNFAVLGNTTVMGNFLALLVPLCLMFAAKRYRWGAWSLLIGAIACTASVMSLGVAWLSSLVVWSLQRRWKTVGTIVGISIILLLGLWWRLPNQFWITYLNPHGRWAIWQTALAFWATHPLNAWIGFGAGSVGAATANGVWDYGFLHNDYLQWLFEFGLIGVGLTLWMMGQTCQALRSFTWTGASTAWLGSALACALLMITGFPLQIGSSLMVGVVSVAAVLSHCQPTGGRYAES